MTLNIGCGSNKIKGSINIDINYSVRPDLVCDVIKSLPFKDNLFDEIYFFHTIEHIEKKYRTHILKEIHRCLKCNGKLYISFPEFSKIISNWLTNAEDKRDFWEATIYGRQLYESDYHVSAVDSLQLSEDLRVVGFKDIQIKQEPIDSFNTVIVALKGVPMMSYEEVIYNEIFK